MPEGLLVTIAVLLGSVIGYCPRTGLSKGTFLHESLLVMGRIHGEQSIDVGEHDLLLHPRGGIHVCLPAHRRRDHQHHHHHQIIMI